MPRPAWARKARDSMHNIGHWIEANGATLTFAFVPSKIMLYPDKLPATVPATLRQACVELAPESILASRLTQQPAGAPYASYYPLALMRASRDVESFYPPGNFHANSRINHLYAQGLLKTLNIDPGSSYSAHEKLANISGDLTSMGFIRTVSAWTYNYPEYKIRRTRKSPEWVMDFFPKVTDLSVFATAQPASNRKAVLLSDSFGAFMAPHLAPGFKRLLHININSISKAEAEPLISAIMARFKPDDIIYLKHDAGLPDHRMHHIGNALSAQLSESSGAAVE